jgi:methylthioribose-1-phosphate isomerase
MKELMSIEFMLGLQIFADIALCLAIVFLIRAANREMKKKPRGISAKNFSEFSRLIEDSRRSTDDLFHALNEVKELVYVLNEKENRLKTLIKESDAMSEDRKSGDSSRGEKHEDVIKMARQGLTEKEISDTLNLTEGEICLILDLHRKKNENSYSHNTIQ